MPDDTRPAGLRRREFAALALAAGMLPAAGAHAADFPPPTLEFAFGATVTLGKPQELGTRGGSRSRFVPITGGKVSGPRLDGVVLPGGGDWQEIGEDGVTLIHARYLLQAADGTAISVDNPGVRVATPAIIARLTAGEDLDPSLYYFRTTPVFAVAPGPHDWLRRSVFVCQGARHPDTVELRIFRVT
ncbi:MAG: DUF3237 domain-containing protein [Pseudomonadota bacterium]